MLLQVVSSPGMYAVTSIPFVSRTLATLRMQSLVFWSRSIHACTYPRFCGQLCMAGAVVLRLLVFLPFLISCCIVGTVQIILVKASNEFPHQFKSLQIYNNKTFKSKDKTNKKNTSCKNAHKYPYIFGRVRVNSRK